MVKALHRAGIEVILDVVYNHTAEGNHLGPMLSFKGIDNASYYRLMPDDPSRYMDFTGTGNSLNPVHPSVLRLIMDSLRYWVTECHVDGFRFDLASALARELYDVDRLSAFFDVIHQDPVLSQVKLIAEPWDLGPGGYQVGNFPVLWTEWNGLYRDTMRDVWRGQTNVAAFASRFTGSSDLYEVGRPAPVGLDQLRHRPRRLHARRPRLLQRQAQRGEPRGQPRRHGRQSLVELRRRGADRRRRGPARCGSASSATSWPRCCCPRACRCCWPATSSGERQRGNNNAWCQDNEISWIDWERDEQSADLLEFTRRLLALRRAHPIFRRTQFLNGRGSSSGLPDAWWFRPDGRRMTAADWQNAGGHALGVFLNGRGIGSVDAHGEPVVDASFVLLLNAHHEDVTFALPPRRFGPRWQTELSTAYPDAPVKLLTARGAAIVTARSLLLLRQPDAPGVG